MVDVLSSRHLEHENEGRELYIQIKLVRTLHTNNIGETLYENRSLVVCINKRLSPRAQH